VRKPPLIAVVGPTASGKTGLSIDLAHQFQAEIIAMDSMQIYRGMDIGTAKPTLQEQEGIKHHMLDVVDPKEPYSVAEYAKQAKVCISGIHERGNLPILVGGTGLYFKALTTSMEMGRTEGSLEVREKFAIIAASTGGNQILHDLLKKADPITAQRLHPNDVKRVIRALEVYELTGRPFSQQTIGGCAEECPYSLLVIGLNMDRIHLYHRIDERVDIMMQNGLQEEVETLLKEGVSPQAQSMQGLGYKELIPVILQGQAIAPAVEAIKQGTRHYAKRQMTWFRKTENIRWLDPVISGWKSDACTITRHFFEISEE